jgi:tape measure domain-containing protein
MSNVDFGIKINLEGAQQATQQTDALGRNFGVLESVAQRMGTVLGAVAGTALTRGFIQLADSVTVLRNQLALSTGSVQQAEVAYGALFQIAQRSRTSFTELGATFASISRATGELGISQGRLLAVTEAIGNAIAISGGSAAGAQAALMQLSQGFASGTLRGEELNSVMEQTPRLARAIADGLGITIGQLRTMGQEGKLTAQAVLGALESQARVLSGELASSISTVAQSMVVLGNAAADAAGKIDKSGGVTQKLSAVIVAAANDLGRFSSVMEDSIKAGDGFLMTLGKVQAFAIGRSGYALLNESAGLLAKTINALSGGMAGLNERIDVMPLSFRTGAEQAQILAQRLTDAETQLAGMLAQLDKGKNDIYFKSQIGDLERYIAQLREAKTARDALQGGSGAGGGRGEVNPETVGQAAARNAIEQQKLAQAMLQYGTATEKANAAVEKLKKELGGAFTPELERRIRSSFVKPTNDAAKELDKQASVLNELMGVTDDYVESLQRLAAMRNTNKLSEEQYLAAVDKVLQRQPAVIAAERQRVAQAQEYLGMQELRAEGEREIAEAEQQASRARQDAVAQVAQQLQGLQDEAEASRLVGQLNITHAQAIARVTLARMEDQRVRLVNDPAELAALEQKIALQRQLVQATDEGAARDANTKAAQDAATAWQSTANDIRTALTDAFRRSFESGESFGRAFGSVIEREIKARLASALAGLVTDGILQVVGGAANLAVSAASGNSATTNWLQGASTAKNAYDLAAGGSMYAQAGNYAAVYSGQAYGTGFATQQSGMLAAQEAGMVSSAGSSTMGSWATSAGWVAAIALGIYKANQDYSEGFRRDGAREVGRETYGLSGTLESTKADILSKLGFSDRLADLLSGATAVSKIIGRADPRVEGTGVQGFLGSGDFAGQSYVDIIEKGGLFRSDKRYQQLGEVPEEIGRLLDSSAAEVLKKAKDYGTALGLPVAALGSVTTDIKVALTDDAEANVKAIAEALGGYGDALVAGFADAVAPLAQYGETTAETLERVGGAMVGVNQVLDTLGLTALQASIGGAQAAVALGDLFGGLQGLQGAAGSYLREFYTDAERTELSLRGIGKVLGDVGLSIPATRDEFRALVEAQDLTTDAGRRAFATLMGVADAFAAATVPAEELAAAADDTARAAAEAAQAIADLQRSIRDGLSQVIGDFVAPGAVAPFRASEVQSALAGGGITASVEQILGSTRGDIVALWNAVGDEGKAAILEAYDAWQAMHDAILAADIAGIVEPLGTSADELLGAYAELTPAADNLVGAWRDTRTQVDELAAALASIDGTAAVSAIDSLRATIAQRDGLAGVISGNADKAFDLRVGQGGQRAVDMLRQREATLWAEFASTNNPAVAQAITQATLQRIALEGELQGDANAAQLDALEQQISAAERLRDLAAEMGGFILSLQAGDLSNRGYAGRLAASESIFSASLTSGQDVQSSATSLLQNAQAMFGGATGAYSDVFESVTGRLRGIGAADYTSTISDAQAQLDALAGIDATAEAQIAALGELNTRFGTGLDSLNLQVEAQTAAVREQVAELRALQANQERQILQFGLALTRLIEASERTAEAVESTADAVELEGAAP